MAGSAPQPGAASTFRSMVSRSAGNWMRPAEQPPDRLVIPDVRLQQPLHKVGMECVSILASFALTNPNHSSILVYVVGFHAHHLTHAQPGRLQPEVTLSCAPDTPASSGYSR
jgi:hypothetical protein